MRSFYFMACVLLIGTFGCAPQLAQKPMGEDEVRWGKYVQKNYSSWTPPQTIPPDKILNPTPLDKGEIVLTPGGATTGEATPAVTPEGGAVVVESTPAATPAATPATAAPVLTDDKTAAAADVAKPAAPEAAAGKTETYTVVKNDSLGKIAKKFKTTTSKIKAANQKVLKGSDRIVPGMKLQIPVR